MVRAVSEVPASVAIAQIYQADLAAVGVNAVVQTDSAAEYTVRVQKGQTGGAWIGTMGSMNLSPFTFFTSNLFARVPNPSGYTSEQYTRLIGDAGSATDDRQLKGIVHDLTEVMLDEAFVLPIAQKQGPDVARSTVKDIGWNSYGMYAFEDVWLEP
jgi:peptide/nickel transport system substrate-binding protein